MTTKLLANQLHSILQDPVEGFTVELADEASLFEWRVYIEGPKDTCYEGGVFQLSLNFPKDYPMSPPVLKFMSDFWHPNVYNDGKVCMSILHPPGDDAMSGELAEERWLPTQSVTTIVLSLMSLLNDPNCSSPANVDASVEWRKNREGYVTKCKKLVEKANKEKPSHVVIPHPDTNEQEHKRVVQKWKEMNKDLDYEDFYEHHDEEDDEDEDDDDEDDMVESNGEINSEDEGVEKKKDTLKDTKEIDVKETEAKEKGKEIDVEDVKSTTAVPSSSSTSSVPSNSETTIPPTNNKDINKDINEITSESSSSKKEKEKEPEKAKEQEKKEKEIEISVDNNNANANINNNANPSPAANSSNPSNSAAAAPQSENPANVSNSSLPSPRKGKKAKKEKKEGGKKKKCIIM